MTRLETYQEGLRFLHQALDALDQADASMRDCGMNDVLQAQGYRRPTLKQAVADMISLCQEAESWECGDCGVAIADHEEDSPHCGWWNAKPYEMKGRKPTMTEAKLALGRARLLTPAGLQLGFVATIEEFDGGYDWDWRWDSRRDWDFDQIRKTRYA